MRFWKVLLAVVIMALVFMLSACQYKSTIERYEFPEDNVVCYYIQYNTQAKALTCMVEK